MEFQGHSFLVSVDFYSDFIECERLHLKTSQEVIRLLKTQMARYGIPREIVTDNGPPFNSQQFELFSNKFEFKHTTSSPRYPQSNGKSESAVKIMKRLMLKAQAAGTDPYLALLDYRNTPTEGLGSSPAQRLMGRRTRTLLPTRSCLLQPEIQTGIQEAKRSKQKMQAKYYNKTAKDLPELREGQSVFMAPKPGHAKWEKAVITSRNGQRSYQVTNEHGRIYRRNRRHLRAQNTATGTDPSIKISSDLRLPPRAPSDRLCRTDDAGDSAEHRVTRAYLSGEQRGGAVRPICYGAARH